MLHHSLMITSTAVIRCLTCHLAAINPYMKPEADLVLAENFPLVVCDDVLELDLVRQLVHFAHGVNGAQEDAVDVPAQIQNTRQTLIGKAKAK